MNTSKTTTATKAPEAAHGTLTSYIAGFVLSLVFTMGAYLYVVQYQASDQHTSGRGVVITVIVAAAIAQLLVQLIFFLHLGRESKPRWNLTVFAFAAVVLGILVFGSLWIMNNLNSRMSPTDASTYIIKDEGIHK